MNNIASLYEFIDRATRNRNYPPNTSSGLKAALKRFEAESNEEERSSVEKFKAHLDQIYRQVVTKNKNFSADSLRVYKSRVMKVIGDYEKYGVDPTKLASWDTKSIVRTKKQKTEKLIEAQKNDNNNEILTTGNTERLELSVRPDSKATIIVPLNLTEEEVARIKTVLDSLVVKG